MKKTTKRDFCGARCGHLETIKSLSYEIAELESQLELTRQECNATVAFHQRINAENSEVYSEAMERCPGCGKGWRLDDLMGRVRRKVRRRKSK